MLKWWIGSNGNHFADCQEIASRYCVAYEHKGRYFVTRNGFPIGECASEEQGKALAENHSNMAKA